MYYTCFTHILHMFHTSNTCFTHVIQMVHIYNTGLYPTHVHVSKNIYNTDIGYAPVLQIFHACIVIHMFHICCNAGVYTTHVHL
jgi:hypothetical protein